MPQTTLAPIDTELEGIAHVLRDRRLSVPPYQRVYSWEAEQLEDYWWDLRAAFGSQASQYFLGTIVLTTGDDENTIIIDGQQRLATTALLFAAIRNEFIRREDPDRAHVIERDYIAVLDLRSAELVPRLTLNPEDRDEFAKAVFTRPGTESGTGAGGVDPNSRIGKALSYFERQIEDESKRAGRHWADQLFGWVDFLEKRARVISVEVSDEADAFLIFETLNARGRELTVADLLKNYLFGLAQDRLDEAQARWMAALQALEASADEEIFTTFVRHLWSSTQGATRERELYSRMKAAITSKRGAVQFTRELATAAPSYAALLSSEHPYWSEHPEMAPLAETLLRLGLEQNRPLLLSAMQRFEAAEFEVLLRSVISWAVRGLIVGGIGGGTTERAYGEAAVLVSEGSASNASDVFDALAPIIPTDDVFRQAFAQRRVNRTTLARYYLTAMALHEEGASDPLVVPYELERNYQLQSVLPRNADPEEWSEFPEDEISQWALRLGNQYLSTNGTGLPAGALLPSSDPPENWSPEHVSARQAELADNAVVVWPRRP